MIRLTIVVAVYFWLGTIPAPIAALWVFHGSRTLQADIGERGLLGHVCHDGLPCWTTTTEAPKETPRP